MSRSFPSSAAMGWRRTGKNTGRTVEDHRINEATHFLRRLHARFGVGLTLDHVESLVVEVEKQICEESILKTQPDGRHVMVANLGRFGRYPVVFNPTTRMIVTVLGWDMVRGYIQEKKRRADERRKLQEAGGTADPVVEDLPGMPRGAPEGSP